MRTRPDCALLASFALASFALASFALAGACRAAPAPDPLASWADGPAKARIVQFVRAVTDPRAATYVPPAGRIATFDNDGTLWSEQPLYVQLAFALDRIRALAPAHPEWQATEPYAAVLRGDMQALAAQGEAGVAALLATTHAGMTTEEFAAIVEDWLATARHPEYGRPYTELVFQPMLELLAYLRANGFQTWIVSGGGIDFMRPWTHRVYGIPPGQVVGSSGGLQFELRDGAPVLVKLPRIDHVDDGPGKPVGIARFIGHRPIAAFGNSDGDLQMLQYTAAGNGPRLLLVVHHTDAEREAAYDRDSHIGRLDQALDEARARDWLVVDTKTDWLQIFPQAQ